MKKLLAVLASVTISASAVGTVGCSVGNLVKSNATTSLEKVIMASSFQAKAAAINSETGISANYMLSTWKKQTLSDVMGGSDVADLGGTDVATVQNLMKSTFGDFNYSINNDDKAKETVNISNNLNQYSSNSISLASSTASTISLVKKVGKLLTGSGVGVNIGKTLAGFLDSNGGIGSQLTSLFDDGGIIDTVSNLLGNNESLLSDIGRYMSGGYDELKTFAKSLDSTLTDEQIQSWTTEQGVEWAQKYLAEGLNNFFSYTGWGWSDADNKLTEGEHSLGDATFNRNLTGTSKGTKKISLQNTLSALIMNVTTIKTGNLNTLITPLVVWGKAFTAYLAEFNNAFNFNSTQTDHAFSATKTNAEFKTEIQNKNFWTLTNVSENTLDLSSIFGLLKAVLSPNKDDKQGTGLTKVLYLVMGSPDKNNRTDIVNEAVDGAYEGVLPLLLTILRPSQSGIVGTLLDSFIKGGNGTTKIASSLSSLLGIVGIKDLDVTALFAAIKGILTGLTDGLAENNFDSMLNSLADLFMQLKAVLTNQSVLDMLVTDDTMNSIAEALKGTLKPIVAQLIDKYLPGMGESLFDSLWENILKPAIADLLKRVIENLPTLLNDLADQTKTATFKDGFNNLLGALSSGKGKDNIWNKVEKSLYQYWTPIEDFLNSLGNLTLSIPIIGDIDLPIGATLTPVLQDAISGVTQPIDDYFNNSNNPQNLTDFTTQPLSKLLGSTGLFDGNGEMARILYQIKNYSIADIVEYLNQYLGGIDASYQLSLGHIGYALQALNNKVKINSGPETNIFDVLKRAVKDKDFKNSIKTVQVIGRGWGKTNEGVMEDLTTDNSKVYTVTNTQTAMYTILGIEQSGAGAGKLINGSLLSALSSVMGPFSDWQNLEGVDADMKASAGENLTTIRQVLKIVYDLGDRFEAGNAAWIKDNFDSTIGADKWSYEMIYGENGDDATKEGYIKYRLIWKMSDNKTKTYTITVKREAGMDAFDTNYWKIVSMYDNDKAITN